jgi:hypothetical protein
MISTMAYYCGANFQALEDGGIDNRTIVLLVLTGHGKPLPETSGLD